MADDKAARARELDRARGRRYRERHPERHRKLSATRAAEYRKRNPETVKEVQARFQKKRRAEVRADPFTFVLAAAPRFWSTVAVAGPKECWEWTGRKMKRDYGEFRISGGVRTPASRAALMLSIGRNLEPGKFACHTCDNPPCCNPAHLYEGTPVQNAADRGARGRQTPRCGVKITAEIARLIFDEKGFHSVIARKVGISRTMVHRIKSGQSWKRIHAPTGTITHA